MPCPYMDKCSYLKIEMSDTCVGRAVYEDGTGYTGCFIYKKYEAKRLEIMEKIKEQVPDFKLS